MGLFDWFRRQNGPMVVPPAQSPVPWISDHVWSLWAKDGLEDSGRSPIEEPFLIVATTADRARAPVAPILDPGPMPETGTPEELAKRLETTPPISRRGTECATWPICCDRPTTLIWNEGWGKPIEQLEHAGPLDMAFLEEEIRTGWGPPEAVERGLREGYGDELEGLRTGRHSGDGINFFQCRACTRVYVGSCHP